MNINFITKGCQPHGRQPFNIDFKLKPTLHPDIQSFVSYYVSMNDLINGFRNWSKIEAAQVKTQSYWSNKTQYLKALNLYYKKLLNFKYKQFLINHNFHLNI